MNDNQNEGKTQGKDEDTTSEIFIGCCEMVTESWACGNCDTLVGTDVQPDPETDWTEYRYVCTLCAEKYKAKL